MGANDGGVFESEVPVSMYEQWQKSHKQTKKIATICAAYLGNVEP